MVRGREEEGREGREGKGSEVEEGKRVRSGRMVWNGDEGGREGGRCVEGGGAKRW